VSRLPEQEGGPDWASVTHSTRRVGRRAASIAAILASFASAHPERPVSLIGLPAYADLMANGLEPRLQAATLARGTLLITPRGRSRGGSPAGFRPAGIPLDTGTRAS